MKTFHSILFFLLSLLTLSLAAEPESYDTTVYLTNTVTQVYTIRKTGTAPTSIPANSTSTIIAAPPTLVPSPSSGTAVPYPIAPSGGNGNGNVTVSPTGTWGAPAPSAFPGAASQLSVNALVAMLAAGVGYLVL